MTATARVTFQPHQLKTALSLPLCVGGRISAGEPEAIDAPDKEHVDLNDHLIAHPEATYGLTVFGDSMDEHEIHSGDLILVDRAIEPTPHSIVVVDVDGALTVKKFSLVGERLFLVPGNKRLKKKEVSQEQRCEVWGVVTYCIHKV